MSHIYIPSYRIRRIPEYPPILDVLPLSEVPPFIQSPGTLHGRIEGEDGVVSFVLGDIQSLRVEEFAVDDYFEVWQDLDITKIHKITTLAGVPNLDSSYGWSLQLLVNSVIFAEKDLPQRIGESTVLLTAPVVREAGVSRVAIRLRRN